MHDYDKIAGIVGEDKINALREAGVEIADKPVKPTTGLLGRWAEDKDGSPVLISSDYVRADGNVWITFLTGRDRFDGGADTASCSLSSLTFPEETTRPEDVPVGEAWLVNVGKRTVPAVKTISDTWYSDELVFVNSEHVTLIAPLVPASPVDSDREPETVTTVQEYVSLPTGSIVAEKECYPVCKRGYDRWESNGTCLSNGDVAGKTRQVLRKGWGE